MLALSLGLLALFRNQAAPELPPWTPVFKGIDHLSATNSRSSQDFENLMVANALRIDLSDPDISLLSSPRIQDYQVNFRETAGRTVSQFLRTNQVQVAINAGFFNPGEYYLPEGTAMTVAGLIISQGESVSPASFSYSASLLVDAANQAQIIPTNWPAINTDGIWTAVSGDYPVLVNGINVGRNYRGRGGIHGIHPRTAIGLSSDRRFLFLLVIDGRQSGYSEGAYDLETAAWLQLLGAQDGINLDGGGSSTMVMEDSTGNPLRLNRSSAVADSGKERTVGCHLGIYAKPVPGFVNDVTVLPDDVAATVSWTTTDSATTAVEYGLSAELGEATPEQTTLATRHAVLLLGLQPGTGYFFRVVSKSGGTASTSPIGFFTTENYLETQRVVALTDSWKSTTGNLDGAAWTAPGYEDSPWDGPGVGLLWVDTRSSGPNPAVEPKGAALAADASTGFPYVTYYFRRQFQSNLAGPGASLLLSAKIDDGAVIYLNGNEIYRLRMDAAPAVILNDTLAADFPCEGDADCRDEVVIGGEAAGHLRLGDNLLAVEVHNYNRRSADMTFGMELWEARSVSVPPLLAIVGADGRTTLSWTRGGFLLQWAESPAGTWTDVPGPVLTSPYEIEGISSNRYYRLRR